MNKDIFIEPHREKQIFNLFRRLKTKIKNIFLSQEKPDRPFVATEPALVQDLPPASTSEPVTHKLEENFTAPNLEVLFKTFKERDVDSRKAAMNLVVERVTKDQTDTLGIEERLSGQYYRMQEADEVLTKLRSGQKTVIVEGVEAAGKTSFLLELENKLFGIPHGYLRADIINEPGKLDRYITSLQAYSSQSEDPVTVIIENGCDLAQPYWEGGYIFYQTIKKAENQKRLLTPSEQRASEYYEKVIQLMKLLQNQQFRIVVGNYTGFFENVLGYDPTLGEMWTSTFQRGTSEYVLSEKPANKDGSLAMLRDHLEYYANGNSTPEAGQPSFLLEQDEPFLQAIAESPHFKFRHFKRISPNNFLKICDELKVSPQNKWDEILANAAQEVETNNEYLR